MQKTRTIFLLWKRSYLSVVMNIWLTNWDLEISIRMSPMARSNNSLKHITEKGFKIDRK